MGGITDHQFVRRRTFNTRTLTRPRKTTDPLIRRISDLNPGIGRRGEDQATRLR